MNYVSSPLYVEVSDFYGVSSKSYMWFCRLLVVGIIISFCYFTIPKDVVLIQTLLSLALFFALFFSLVLGDVIVARYSQIACIQCTVTCVPKHDTVIPDYQYIPSVMKVSFSCLKYTNANILTLGLVT